MESDRDMTVGREQDEAQIREIIYRLARSIDRMDWEGVKAVSDADTCYDYGVYKGDAAGLVGWMSERHKNVFRSSHVIANILIEFSGNSALAETYVNSIQTVPSGADSAQQLNILSWARYIDEFQNVGGRWRLKLRTVLLDNQVSTAAHPLPGGLKEGRRDWDDMLWTERSRLGLPGAA